VQQFRAGFEAEFATAALSAARCSMQFVLPNRTPLPATREAGLVQIAKARFQDCQYRKPLQIALKSLVATRGEK